MEVRRLPCHIAPLSLMKNTIIIGLLFLSILGNALLWQRVSALDAAAAAARADFPLGETMGYLQRYAEKLWYAGESNNWELAHYYHDELAETAESVIAAKVEKDGIPVSIDMTDILPPALKSVGDAIAAKDETRFREAYGSMVKSCDACHETAKHPFIRITIPQNPPSAWNQDFTTGD